MAMPDVWIKVTMQLSSPQRFKFYNVFYSVPAEGPTWTANPTLDCKTIGDAIHGGHVIDLPSVLTQNTQIVGAAFELHKSGIVYETSTITGDPGTIDDDELPDYSAVVIQKRTDTAGKKGRGRWFLGPVPESLTDEDFLTDAAVLLYNPVATAFLSPTTALGTSWVPQLHSVVDNDLKPLTSVYVDVKLGRIGGRKSRSILT